MASRVSYDLNNITPSFKEASTFDWAHRHRDAETKKPGSVITHFGDLKPALLRFIEGSDAIVGCIAWITSSEMVDVLSQRPVALIVNKEPFLKPNGKTSAARQRATLARLQGGLRRRDFPEPLNRMFQSRTDTIDAVRCVGHTGARVQNAPLMHHKFAVRLTNGKPTAVWTGSFNWTVNASSSIENAVEIHDPNVAAQYLAEFARVASLSEPLDYLSSSVKPQWHLGTTQEKEKAATTPRATKTKTNNTATRKTRATGTAKKSTGAAGRATTAKKAAATKSKATTKTQSASARNAAARKAAVARASQGRKA